MLFASALFTIARAGLSFRLGSFHFALFGCPAVETTSRWMPRSAVNSPKPRKRSRAIGGATLRSSYDDDIEDIREAYQHHQLEYHRFSEQEVSSERWHQAIAHSEIQTQLQRGIKQNVTQSNFEMFRCCDYFESRNRSCGRSIEFEGACAPNAVRLAFSSFFQ